MKTLPVDGGEENNTAHVEIVHSICQMRHYSGYEDASNYERLESEYKDGAFHVRVVAAGTGVKRPIIIEE